MTPEEARLNLDACTLRPGDVEPEARSLAENDPLLGVWMEKRAAFDEKVAHTFNASPVPTGLNDRLLAAMMAEATAPAPATTSRSAWMSWLALAAVMTLSAVGLWWNASQPPAWQSEALAIVKNVNAGKLPLDAFSPDMAKLKSVLAQASAPSPEILPADLKALAALGCKVIQIGGRPASVVCFKITPNKEAHLITFNVTDVSGAPPEGTPQFASRDGWHTASWKTGDQGYFLATQADEQALKALFAMVQTLGRIAGLV